MEKVYSKTNEKEFDEKITRAEDTMCHYNKSIMGRTWVWPRVLNIREPSENMDKATIPLFLDGSAYLDILCSGNFFHHVKFYSLYLCTLCINIKL